MRPGCCNNGSRRVEDLLGGDDYSGLAHTPFGDGREAGSDLHAFGSPVLVRLPRPVVQGSAKTAGVSFIPHYPGHAAGAFVRLLLFLPVVYVQRSVRPRVD